MIHSNTMNKLKEKKFEVMDPIVIFMDIVIIKYFFRFVILN